MIRMIELFKDKEHQLKASLDSIATTLDKPEDKWSFLYHYARKSLDEEISRFQRIDDKSVKLLSSISIVITVFLALFKWVVEDSNVNFSSYVYVVASLIFIALSGAWYYFFTALKLQLAPRMPINDEIFNLVKEKNMASIHVALYKSCKTAVEKSFDVIEKKAEQLKKGYLCTSVAASILVLFVAMLSFETIAMHKKPPYQPDEKVNVSMPNENNTNDQQADNTNEPDLDITAPDIQFVTNDNKTPIETKD